MSDDGKIELAGGIAVLAAAPGHARAARLVWADSLFVEEFAEAEPGAAAFGDDAPAALLAAIDGIAEGAVTHVACAPAQLFAGRYEGTLRVVGLGGGRVLLALAVAAENEAQAAESRLAETLDAVPVAAALVAVADGTILWLNAPFRELLDGSEFDLMGTSLAGHFALPGAFKTLIAATGKFAASAPMPTPLKTLSGIMTPVAATAKRMPFRGQEAALVCLSHGF
jgi:PAS domain-containing protein